MQINKKLPDDMQVKWDRLSAKFAEFNAARPALLRLQCAACAPSNTRNGIGQEVQAHFWPMAGWIPVSDPYPCRCVAESARVSVAVAIDRTDIDAELRVYEALAG